MTGALILISTEVGSMKEVHEKVKKLDQIQDTEMLTGPYDIMAIARAEEMSYITNTLIGKIRDIEGVQDTVTNIFIK
ncbi:hypothetical protein AKJ55_00080 [candidate division MSBL1 archaeon SCGC-AAA382M17]|uniref:Transcription regulator AsnC/Lrp ligand binding domain-containing protein n=1 Tax=candidate division MSBL1 archaeon SCGC-AAA382M17 TaxID=1698284 RepID=A0ABR5TKC9_9EURY|nr:hypothetical protein AKJ55_00080 [candidate division MSBL1 archaeon SCGC-AAA382M17]